MTLSLFYFILSNQSHLFISDSEYSVFTSFFCIEVEAGQVESSDVDHLLHVMIVHEVHECA